jgi:RNA polymerase sigma-70 factor, ECF subfamily
MLGLWTMSDAARTAAPKDGAEYQVLLQMRPLLKGIISGILKLSPGHVEVEDCAQESIRRGLVATVDLGEPERKRAVMVGIARNVAIDRLRQIIRERRRLTALPEDDSADGASDGVDGESRTHARLDAQRVLARLSALPEGQRRALQLSLAGHDYEQIGRHLGVPLGTVATWIARAKLKLQEDFKDAMQTPPKQPLRPPETAS